MGVERSQHSPCRDAVAGRAVLRDAQSDILHVSQDTALARSIERKFRPVARAGRSHKHNGFDGRYDPVFFCDGNGSLQIDIDLAAALLDTCVIDENLNPADFRKSSCDIRHDMRVVGSTTQGIGTYVHSDDFVPLLQVFQCARQPDSAGRAGDQNFHLCFPLIIYISVF